MADFIQIYVEGDGDVQFISDYINHIIPNVVIDKNKKVQILALMVFPKLGFKV